MGLPLPAVAAPFSGAFRAALPALIAAVGQPRGRTLPNEPSRSRAPGHSGTFVGHRPYAPGDDLRRIDWAAYARSGELHVKRFEQEERRAATLLLDLSPRLLCGSPQRRLAQLRLAAVLGGAMLRHLDALAVVAPGGPPNALFAGVAAQEGLLLHLERLPVVAAPAAAALPLLCQRGVPQRVYWLGDFAGLDAVAPVLAAVRRRGGSVTGILPALASDLQPPVLGYQRIVDPETGAAHAVVVDQAMAEAVASELATHARAQALLFAQSGCRWLRWPVPAADDLQAAPYRGLAVLGGG